MSRFAPPVTQEEDAGRWFLIAVTVTLHVLVKAFDGVSYVKKTRERDRWRQMVQR